jgi:radical SAM protein with 4Fe4S-binding SPASM domain
MRGADTRVTHAETDFNRTPLLVIWETTQSCALACQHCRADARLGRSSEELTTAQGKALLDRVKAMGTRVVALSGGDPMNRPDLPELINHGASIGIRMCTIPAATSTLTRDQLKTLRDAGLSKVAFSLDFPFAAGHDEMRQIPGTFDRTIQAAAWARELGISLQINSLVCQSSAEHLIDMGELVHELGADMWELMYLIPVGRGTLLPSMTPQQVQESFARVWQIEQQYPDMVVKVTEAPHYRRYMVEQGYDGPLHRVNAGRGFCFISHVGDVYPSGFLPFKAGNVKDEDLVDIYRDSTLFRQLRDSDLLEGPCGSCSWRDTCGGSRSRTYGLTGNPYASEPWCIHATATQPASLVLA